MDSNLQPTPNAERTAGSQQRMVSWSSNWPTTPGLYWFYGWPFGNGEREPEWNLVKVMKVSNGVLTIRDGTFWDKSGGWLGMFCEAELPEPPKLRPANAALCEVADKPRP